MWEALSNVSERNNGLAKLTYEAESARIRVGQKRQRGRIDNERKARELPQGVDSDIGLTRCC